MLTLLIPYLIAITLLTITPGLDTTLVIRTATIEGKAKAFQAALGITLGCIVWGVVVACGLGALLMTSDLAFNMLKWMGAAYLAWLGLNLLLKPRTQLADINDTTNTQNWFVKGFFGKLTQSQSRCLLPLLSSSIYSTHCFSCDLDDGLSHDPCCDWDYLVYHFNLCDAINLCLPKTTKVY